MLGAFELRLKTWLLCDFNIFLSFRALAMAFIRSLTVILFSCLTLNPLSASRRPFSYRLNWSFAATTADTTAVAYQAGCCFVAHILHFMKYCYHRCDASKCIQHCRKRPRGDLIIYCYFLNARDILFAFNAPVGNNLSTNKMNENVYCEERCEERIVGFRVCGCDRYRYWEWTRKWTSKWRPSNSEDKKNRYKKQRQYEK